MGYKNSGKYTTYLIKNIINQKLYVGITCHTIKQRFIRHLNDAKNHCNPTSIFHRAIRKYGKRAFRIKILKIFESKVKALKAEIYFIKKFNSKVPNGYNLTGGGEGAFGIKRTTKEKRMISERFSKPVIRGDSKIFKSMTEAAKKSNTNCSNIIRSIRGLTIHAAGYTWKYADNDPVELRRQNRKYKESRRKLGRFPERKVKCLNNNKIYRSISEAQKDLGLNYLTHISDVCQGIRHHDHGFKFEYIKE
jgi:group I intron endonuclease